MKQILLAVSILFSVSVFGQGKNMNVNFTIVLQNYNHSGLVDYSNLKNDEVFKYYLMELSRTNPDTLSSKYDKLAFWIDAYNAFTIQRILKSYPIESINDLHRGGRILAHIFGTTVWDEKFIVINKNKYSLNDIEHGIIRKKFKDPRVHFALVCASISCPKLRSEAYEGYKIDLQLDEQAKIFFADPTKNRFDTKNKIAHISKILDWYESDFAENDTQLLKFIARYVQPELRNDIQSNINNWEIEYLDYNWGLNDFK